MKHSEADWNSRRLAECGKQKKTGYISRQLCRHPAHFCDTVRLTPFHDAPPGAHGKGKPMKTTALSLTAAALLLGISLAPFAVARPEAPAPLLEGKGHPILLKRMVVTATLLPS